MLQHLGAISAAAANAVLKGPLDHHVDLEGADSDIALYTASGSLVSLFDWQGVRETLDRASMSNAADVLRDRLSGWLDAPGHALQIVYSRDPLRAGEQVRDATAQTETQMRLQGLDLSDVLDDRRRSLQLSGAEETTILAVMTHPAVIVRQARDDARRTTREQLAGLLPLRDAQVPLRVAEEVRQVHAALVDSLPGDFRLAGQELRLLDAATAAQVIAGSLTPGGEAAGFVPRLAGVKPDGTPGRVSAMPETRASLSGSDYSLLGTERLSWQLLRDHALVGDDGSVRIGSCCFQPFDLALAPEILAPFGDLVRATVNTQEPIRWRMSILIESGGWAGTTWKRLWSTFFTFLSRTHNTRIRDAFQELEHLDGAEETIVRFRACFACWDDAGEEARLRRAVARLRQAVERWANARTEMLAGDPVACLLGSLPGAGVAPTAPSAAAPLTDAMALTPLERPCSPWSSGPMSFMTAEGRLWPYQPGSSLQDSWSDILTGAPGSGKSVLLNAMNAATILSGAAGDDPLPIIGVIDIGASSTGLVTMMQEALPLDRPNGAVSARLRNDREFSINVFDTPLGFRRPTPLGRTFLVNFVRLLLDISASGPELSGLIGTAIDQAYDSTADHREAKRWNEGVLPAVDEVLFDSGWEPDDNTTWWECVDWLSDHGSWEAAAAAQRQAVPLLSELAAAAAAPRVADNYREMRLQTGEPALDGLRRVLAEAAADWPMLSFPTEFDLSGARLRVVDLQDVVSRSSEPTSARQSAIMYMLARHVCTDGFFLAPEDVSSQNLRKSQDQRLTRQALLARRTPKRLSIDEFHRAGGLPGVVDQLATDIREGRKHNVQICLASQLLADFNPRLVAMSTGVWICNASETDIEFATGTLHLNSAAANILRHRLTGPGPEGAPVFAALAVKGGNVRQLLTHRLGGSELWAYSTTAEDVALRDELTGLLGSSEARRALATRFPGGSARREIQRRASAGAISGERLETIPALAAEIASDWRKSQ